MMNLNCHMIITLCEILKIMLNISLKKHETLTTIPPIHVHINRINNRLVFKIEDGFKLEVQTIETMKLFGSTKKLIDKTKNEEKVSNLEVGEVVLAQCNLVDNQYQKKFKVLYSFTPNKCYAYLLNVKQNDLVFLKTYNTEVDEIIDQVLRIKMVDH